MKKNYKKIYGGMIKMMTLTVLFILTLGSCEKFLDVKKTGTQKFIETTDDCQRILDQYDLMNTNYSNDNQISCDDYYLGTNSFPAGLSIEDQSIYTWQTNAIRKGTEAPQWLNPYTIVYNVNLVIEVLDRIKDKSDASTWNNVKGSALFIRAYVFWNIAQQYANPYGSNTINDPGIPLRVTPDLNENLGRGTLKQTYDKITQDLKEAVSLLNPTSIVPTRPNKASAYAMLARTYLSMEDYGQALTNADASLQLYQKLINYNNLNSDSENPFVKFNDEVLFHSTMGSSDLLLRGDPDNPAARINDDLYALYNNNDLRKVVFFKPNVVGIDVHNPAYDSDNTKPKNIHITFPDGTYRFTGNYESINSGTLFNGLTVGEMFLTRAECYARTGNTTSALTDLNTLLGMRWRTNTYVNLTNASPETNTTDKVIKKILEERRKELVMRGQRWTDLRRINKDARFKVDLNRQLKKFIPVVTGTYPDINKSVEIQVTQSWNLPANDPRYTLLIPQEVINGSSFQQNVR